MNLVPAVPRKAERVTGAEFARRKGQNGRGSAITQARNNGEITMDPDGLYDLSRPENANYLHNISRQQRQVKRKQAAETRLTAEPEDLMGQLPAGFSIERTVERPAGEALYPRASVEDAMLQMLDKCLDLFESDFTLPYCEKLAAAMRGAKSTKKAAQLIRKEIEDTANLVEDNQEDFGVRYILDGPDAAYSWYDANFDEDGNPHPPAPGEEADIEEPAPGT